MYVELRIPQLKRKKGRGKESLTKAVKMTKETYKADLESVSVLFLIGN